MKSDKILITGGAGFIGSNLAHQLIGQGHTVTIFDNMSRSGCQQNISWLQQTYGADRFRLLPADLSDFESLKRATEGAERVYHFAGQVAVTTSVKQPRQDFMSNALGTFNALEAARAVGNDPIFIYSSSNKVYGGMEHIEIEEGGERYRYATLPHGIPETQGIDFHSPYGCSKGAGDQYTHDYARIYGLRTVVARQSCIYGYRQFGIEDQGWVAWFIIAALKGRPISIYGNGKQVRDVLFIDDLLAAYAGMVAHIDKTAGQIYNIGGGAEHTISIWQEFGPLLEELLDKYIPVTYETWRPGDQPIYVSDIRKAKQDFGWEPKVSVAEGIKKLATWIQNNKPLFDHL